MNKLCAALLLLVLSCILVHPVSAPVEDPDISLEPREINAYVCSRFSVDIWITNLPGPMTWFNFTIVWDPNLMELVDRENYAEGRGWQYKENLGDGKYSAEPKVYGPGWTEDAAWVKLTFHCLGEGTSEIYFDDASIFIQGYITPDLFICIVHQYSRPVGGISTPVNKLAILTPYLALLGLVGAVIGAVGFRRRRKT